MKMSPVAALAVGVMLGGVASRLLAPQITQMSQTGPPPELPPARLAEPCPWPASLDAVAAAPQNHRILLENDRVRVLDVTVAPGEREPVHAHCNPSVLYVMRQGRGRDYDAEGRLIDEATEAPPASQFPMTFWFDRSPPHSVHNLDTIPIHLLRLELKR